MTDHHPPQWADRLLESFCAPHLLEEVQGDLQELYAIWRIKYGNRKADRLYFWHVIKFIRPFALKRKRHFSLLNNIDMLKNHFLIAFRNLKKHKSFAAINTIGLTVGIACCLLLLLYIYAESSYDQHHTHAQSLFRVTTKFQNIDGIDDHLSTASPPIAMGLLQEFPEVANATRVVNPPGVDQNLIKYQEHSFFEENGLLADSTFFQMFDYQFIEGNPDKALSQPNTVVLSKKLAHKLFGADEALGKVILISNNISEHDYMVSGVFEDNNNKTHIDANFFTSMESEGLGTYVANNDQWAGQNFVFSYIQLNLHASPQALEAKLPAFLNKYGAEDLKAQGIQKTLHLQSVPSIHLYSTLKHELSQNGNILYIYVLSAIAIFVLLIACINFMNLSTAKASQRAAEVGVRKTLGASQSLLIRQFLSESMLIVGISVLLSWLLIELLLPFFNQLTEKEISLSMIDWTYYLLAAGVLTIVTSVLAGAYPAFFLASFQPAKVLKGKMNMSLTAGLLRKGLVIFQFVISICLISGVIIILSQLNFMRQQELGFESESRVVVPLRTPEAAQQYHSIKNQLSQQHEIQKLSASSTIPGRNVLNDIRLYPVGSNMENGIYTQRYFVDEQFTETLGIRLVQGRNFSADAANKQENQILINQLGLKKLGISDEEAIGTTLFTDYEGETMAYEVIGVISDFHQMSLHQPMVSTIFHPGSPENFSYMVASVHPEDMQTALSSLKNMWKERIPGLPFEYSLLDQQIQQQYESENRMFQVISSFTLIAILISCMGLYGLSAFVAERKVKEIGVRKVLGAEVSSIVKLLSRDFTKLVILAIIISTPLSYYAMRQWLEIFTFRIELSPLFFILSGIIALVMAWLTVGYHSIKAALANPVTSLRSE